MDKALLTQQIIQNLQSELLEAIHAAEEAHAGATHEQSKAETQYDTLGLEHAYLAEGQSRRIEELRQGISKLENWIIPEFTQDDEVYLGAGISLKSESNDSKLCLFLTPAGGGQKIQSYQIITPSTPLGQALLGLCIDEYATLSNGQRYLIEDIF